MSGLDKRVAVLSLSSLTETTSKWKPLPKGSIDAMATCSFAAENPVLAISGERATVWSLCVLPPIKNSEIRTLPYQPLKSLVFLLELYMQRRNLQHQNASPMPKTRL